MATKEALEHAMETAAHAAEAAYKAVQAQQEAENKLQWALFLSKTRLDELSELMFKRDFTAAELAEIEQIDAFIKANEKAARNNSKGAGAGAGAGIASIAAALGTSQAHSAKFTAVPPAAANRASPVGLPAYWEPKALRYNSGAHEAANAAGAAAAPRHSARAPRPKKRDNE
jgi:hypothetical protein